MNFNLTCIFNFVLIIFISCGQSIIAQTSEIANYEIYTRESNQSSIGYFSVTVELPQHISHSEFTQHGLSYNHYYDITNLGSIPVGYDNQFSFYLTGVFRIAAATGTLSLDQSFLQHESNNPKFYSLNVDIYSLYIIPEYTYVIKRGYAVTAKFGINLINIGGTATFPEKGVIREHLFATINLLPLSLSPSVFFDFGRSGLGLLFHINPGNFLSYNIAPRNLYGDERGLASYNSFIKRFDMEIIFVF